MPSSLPERGAAPRVVVVGSGAALAGLGPLLDAYERRYAVAAIERDQPPVAEELAAMARGAAAVLLVAPRRRSPRTVVPGPSLPGPDGVPVPVGVVPDLGPEPLRRFATTAASVQERPEEGCSVALLAQRSGRYRDLARRVRRLLDERCHGTQVSWWTADEVVRHDLVTGLGLGLAIAVYLGHGRPVGWVGYGGTRAHHLTDPATPVAAVLSLACLTASRRRTGLSFSEALVMQGCTAAAVGAVAPTLHTHNARWSLGVAQAIASGATTVGTLVAAAEPTGGPRPYRIIGDPMAPLRDAPGARDAARAFSELVSMPVAPAMAS